MAKLSVFSTLLVCVLAVAAAQDATNTGGQAGSVTSDPAAPTTSPPTATAPPSTTNAPPAAGAAPVNPVAPDAQAPAPVVAPAPAAGPGWAGNPAPMTDVSGSGSFGSGSDIETPVTRKPRKVSDSSRSQSSEPTPSEDSGAQKFATTSALGLAVLLGLAFAML